MSERALLLVSLLLASSTVASAGGGKNSVKQYDLSGGNVTGETVRGPRTITARKLNVLRYDYTFSRTVSYTQTVDYWSQLTTIAAPTPSSPPSTPVSPTTKAPKAAGEAAPQSCEDELQQAGIPDKYIKHLCSARDLIKSAGDRNDMISKRALTSSDYQEALIDDLDYVNCQVSVVSAAGKSLSDFLKRAFVGPENTIVGVESMLADSPEPCNADSSTSQTFMSGVRAKWIDFSRVAALRQESEDLQIFLQQQTKSFPQFSTDIAAQIAITESTLNADSQAIKADKTLSADQKSASLQEIATEMGNLEVAKSNLKADADLLDWATQQNNKVLSGIADLEQGSQKYNAFVSAHDSLITWQSRMTGLHSDWAAYQSGQSGDPFSKTTDASCEFAFSRTKTTAITLTRTDLLPGTTSGNPETVLSISVECTSPFTVSAGVAFSTIRQHEFTISPVATPPGSTTTTNEFVETANSRFHPLPIGMIHARFCEPSDTVSFHLSFGMAGNINSQSAGGSNAEFLIGPSIGLFRTMFFTLGLHVGQKTTLGSGFKINDPVPSNITQPPLQKSYVPALGVAITFTKP